MANVIFEQVNYYAYQSTGVGSGTYSSTNASTAKSKAMSNALNNCGDYGSISYGSNNNNNYIGTILSNSYNCTSSSQTYVDEFNYYVYTYKYNAQKKRYRYTKAIVFNMNQFVEGATLDSAYLKITPSQADNNDAAYAIGVIEAEKSISQFVDVGNELIHKSTTFSLSTASTKTIDVTSYLQYLIKNLGGTNTTATIVIMPNGTTNRNMTLSSISFTYTYSYIKLGTPTAKETSATIAYSSKDKGYNFSWSASSATGLNKVDHYELSNSSGTIIANNIKATSSSYTLPAPDEGKTIKYRIRAISTVSGYDSDYLQFSLTTHARPAVPTASNFSLSYPTINGVINYYVKTSPPSGITYICTEGKLDENAPISTTNITLKITAKDTTYEDVSNGTFNLTVEGFNFSSTNLSASLSLKNTVTYDSKKYANSYSFSASSSGIPSVFGSPSYTYQITVNNTTFNVTKSGDIIEQIGTSYLEGTINSWEVIATINNKTATKTVTIGDIYTPLAFKNTAGNLLNQWASESLSDVNPQLVYHRVRATFEANPTATLQSVNIYEDEEGKTKISSLTTFENTEITYCDIDLTSFWTGGQLSYGASFYIRLTFLWCGTTKEISYSTKLQTVKNYTSGTSIIIYPGSTAKTKSETLFPFKDSEWHFEYQINDIAAVNGDIIEPCKKLGFSFGSNNSGRGIYCKYNNNFYFFSSVYYNKETSKFIGYNKNITYKDNDDTKITNLFGSHPKTSYSRQFYALFNTVFEKGDGSGNLIYYINLNTNSVSFVNNPEIKDFKISIDCGSGTSTNYIDISEITNYRLYQNEIVKIEYTIKQYNYNQAVTIQHKYDSNNFLSQETIYWSKFNEDTRGYYFQYSKVITLTNSILKGACLLSNGISQAKTIGTYISNNFGSFQTNTTGTFIMCPNNDYTFSLDTATYDIGKEKLTINNISVTSPFYCVKYIDDNGTFFSSSITNKGLYYSNEAEDKEEIFGNISDFTDWSGESNLSIEKVTIEQTFPNIAASSIPIYFKIVVSNNIQKITVGTKIYTPKCSKSSFTLKSNSYVIFGRTPLVLYKSGQLGINTSVIEDDTHVLYITSTTEERNYIALESKFGSKSLIKIDLNEGTIVGLTIDGGSW